MQLHNCVHVHTEASKLSYNTARGVESTCKNRRYVEHADGKRGKRKRRGKTRPPKATWKILQRRLWDVTFCVRTVCNFFCHQQCECRSGKTSHDSNGHSWNISHGTISLSLFCYDNFAGKKKKRERQSCGRTISDVWSRHFRTEERREKKKKKTKEQFGGISRVTVKSCANLRHSRLIYVHTTCVRDSCKCPYLCNPCVYPSGARVAAGREGEWASERARACCSAASCATVQHERSRGELSLRGVRAHLWPFRAIDDTIDIRAPCPLIPSRKGFVVTKLRCRKSRRRRWRRTSRLPIRGRLSPVYARVTALVALHRSDLLPRADRRNREWRGSLSERRVFKKLRESSSLGVVRVIYRRWDLKNHAW